MVPSDSELRYGKLCEYARAQGWRVAITTARGRLDTLDVWKGKPNRSQLMAREPIIGTLEEAAEKCYSRMNGS